MWETLIPIKNNKQKTSNKGKKLKEPPMIINSVTITIYKKKTFYLICQ